MFWSLQSNHHQAVYHKYKKDIILHVVSGRQWTTSLESSVATLTFSLLMCTFGLVASLFEFYQCVLLFEVKVLTLKVHFVSLSAHCVNAENSFQHL
jgi:hypothetical protein